MRLGLCLTAIACAIGLSSTANACRQLNSETKFRLSDVVVQGVAHCEAGVEHCLLRVRSVDKGDDSLVQKTIKISVDLRPPIKRSGDTIVLGHCPQTFEPWKSETTGRFYLVATSDGAFDAAHPPDVSEAELFEGDLFEDKFEELDDRPTP